LKKLRRKNKIDNCITCNQPFEHFKWDKQIYCSKNCHYKKLKIKTICAVCNKELLKSKSNIKRNTINYCSRDCYNNRKGETLKKVKRNTSYFLKLIEKGCECGIKEYYLLQIHHKDGNTNNNSPENHEVVCANCHIKRHLKLNKKGKLIYHTKTLTDKKISECLK
jgi:hypothetical protein